MILQRKIWLSGTPHILAQAVQELFPSAKIAIGPAIESGFYYDFDVEEPFTPEDLIAIETMAKRGGKETRFNALSHRWRRSAPISNAGEKYKLELSMIEGSPVFICKVGRISVVTMFLIPVILKP